MQIQARLLQLEFTEPSSAWTGTRAGWRLQMNVSQTPTDTKSIDFHSRLQTGLDFTGCQLSHLSQISGSGCAGPQATSLAPVALFWWSQAPHLPHYSLYRHAQAPAPSQTSSPTLGLSFRGLPSPQDLPSSSFSYIPHTSQHHWLNSPSCKYAFTLLVLITNLSFFFLLAKSCISLTPFIQCQLPFPDVTHFLLPRCPSSCVSLRMNQAASSPLYQQGSSVTRAQAGGRWKLLTSVPLLSPEQVRASLAMTDLLSHKNLLQKGHNPQEM